MEKKMIKLNNSENIEITENKSLNYPILERFPKYSNEKDNKINEFDNYLEIIDWFSAPGNDNKLLYTCNCSTITKNSKNDSFNLKTDIEDCTCSTYNLQLNPIPLKTSKTSFTKNTDKLFENYETNICYNLLDRHCRDNKSILVEFNDGKLLDVTNKTLLDRVMRWCHVILGIAAKISAKNGNIEKNLHKIIPTLTIFTPSTVDSLALILACTRLALPFTVVFSGYSAESLIKRMEDCKSNVVVMFDFYQRGIQKLNFDGVLKEICDYIDTNKKSGVEDENEISDSNYKLKNIDVIILKEEERKIFEQSIDKNNNKNNFEEFKNKKNNLDSSNQNISSNKNVKGNKPENNCEIKNYTNSKNEKIYENTENITYHSISDYNCTSYIRCVPVTDDIPMFYLYTSGSTGKPKGVIHGSIGYLLGSMISLKETFINEEKSRENEITFFCSADFGWITGHTYTIFGPLALGIRTVVPYGIPTIPESKLLNTIKNSNSICYYTAPTVIRLLKGMPYYKDAGKNTSNGLKSLGSVGEPIDSMSLNFFESLLGANLIETYFQTETGTYLFIGDLNNKRISNSSDKNDKERLRMKCFRGIESLYVRESSYSEICSFYINIHTINSSGILLNEINSSGITGNETKSDTKEELVTNTEEVVKTNGEELVKITEEILEKLKPATYTIFYKDSNNYKDSKDNSLEKMYKPLKFLKNPNSGKIYIQSSVNELGNILIAKSWPSMFKGILNDQKRYNEYFEMFSGYYFTGDEGVILHDGECNICKDLLVHKEKGHMVYYPQETCPCISYTVKGRTDDVLNVSGHRLSTGEIEDSICKMANVLECAVIGIPDDITGEALGVFVKMDKSSKNNNEEFKIKLKEHLRNTIGRIISPKFIFIINDLPKTRTGKILRRTLKNIYLKQNLGDVSTLIDESVIENIRDVIDRE